MHTIEPFFLWRDYYNSENDVNALNYQKEYSEFHYTNRIYNYLIHPQWDSFGSETLFYKQLWTDYSNGVCIIEFIGEWNDVIENDIMAFKHELIDDLIQMGIHNFILIYENVLNMHIDIDDYYLEWKEEIEGDIFIINCLDHVEEEIEKHGLKEVLKSGGVLNEVNWRSRKPTILLPHLKELLRLEELEDY